jgi:hypothetical protein
MIRQQGLSQTDNYTATGKANGGHRSVYRCTVIDVGGQSVCSDYPTSGDGAVRMGLSRKRYRCGWSSCNVANVSVDPIFHQKIVRLARRYQTRLDGLPRLHHAGSATKALLDDSQGRSEGILDTVTHLLEQHPLVANLG